MGQAIVYTIKQMLDLEFKYDWLVSKFLMVGDVWLIKAQKKVGKGVLSQQLAFALSCGERFLGCFDTKGPCKVAYLSGEGYIGNWQSRIRNMKKMWKCDEDNITFIDCIGFKLHGDNDAKQMLEILVKQNVNYDVLIFDPLFRLCANGDINSNADMAQFFGNVEMMVKHFSASAIVVHHDSEKVYRDNRGQKHSSASVKNAMGASAITWAASHYATLTTYKDKNKKKIHRLQMGDCRSSDYVDDIEFCMITPESDELGRLGYTTDVEDTNVHYHAIKEYLYKNRKVSDHKIYDTIGVASATFYRNIKKLQDHGFVTKDTDAHGKHYYVWNDEMEVENG